jgi:hypothetical protein
MKSGGWTTEVQAADMTGTPARGTVGNRKCLWLCRYDVTVCGVVGYLSSDEALAQCQHNSLSTSGDFVLLWAHMQLLQGHQSAHRALLQRSRGQGRPCHREVRAKVAILKTSHTAHAGTLTIPSPIVHSVKSILYFLCLSRRDTQTRNPLSSHQVLRYPSPGTLRR